MSNTFDIQQLEKSYYYSNATNALYAEWGKKFGLTYDSLFVLYAIYYKSEPCCQKTICQEWSLPKQTVCSILKGFEKKGYICFVSNETDKRNKLIELTAEGLIFAQSSVERLGNIELAVVKKMGKEMMQAYLDTSALYYQCFKEEMQKEKEHD